MAGPSSMVESDFLFALQLQLEELEANDLSPHFLASDVPPPELALPSDTPSPEPESPMPELVSDSESLPDVFNPLDSPIPEVISDADSLSSFGLPPDSPVNALLPPVDFRPASKASSSRRTPDSVMATAMEPKFRCPVCFESTPTADGLVLGKCGERFCADCIHQYLGVLAKDAADYPITCPTCSVTLDDDKCLRALENTPHYEAFTLFMLKKVHHKALRYCANVHCGIAFDFEPGAPGCTSPTKVQCVLCRTSTCAECREEWHEGKSCGDAKSGNGVNNLVQEKGWQQCPNCRAAIDKRRDDCNYVKCTCGTSFCYACGEPYIHTKPTEENSHGLAKCSCPLFPEDEEFSGDEDDDNVDVLFGLDDEYRDVDDDDDDDFDAMDEADYVDLYDEDDLVWGMMQADHLLDVEEGQRIGNVDLNAALARGLPQRMADRIRQLKCPYHGCDSEFHNMEALEQHIMNVMRHPVWVCCGRPFGDARAFWQHRYTSREHTDEPLGIDFDNNTDHDVNYANGVKHGTLDLDLWLRKGLPARIEEPVRQHECPYHNCTAEFGSMHALEQHIMNVRRHPVWVCCGRPFLTEQAFRQHQNSAGHEKKKRDWDEMLDVYDDSVEEEEYWGFGKEFFEPK